MVAISGISHHGRPAYIVERKVVRYVRLRAYLARDPAEAVVAIREGLGTYHHLA
jgi:hypothetical protein